MTRETHSKVQARHLQRHAYLYIRQSSLRQVLEHTESTQRQYNLRQRAIALGWAADQIVVVDNDQGLSGASAVDRAGFQTLVADVGLGRAGMVMGLEVSRLARNSTDWHRLLEICALTDTLILDEDGIYDPAHFNDRLLLGLKGTMSEAELHVLRARLIGGILNKARRGELQCRVPIGLVYDAAGRVVLDPDQQVQHTIRALFETFRRTGSATATARRRSWSRAPSASRTSAKRNGCSMRTHSCPIRRAVCLKYFFRTGRGAILQGAVWDPSIPSFPLLMKDAGYHIGKSYKVWSPGTPGDAPYGRQHHRFPPLPLHTDQPAGPLTRPARSDRHDQPTGDDQPTPTASDPAVEPSEPSESPLPTRDPGAVAFSRVRGRGGRGASGPWPADRGPIPHPPRWPAAAGNSAAAT